MSSITQHVVDLAKTAGLFIPLLEIAVGLRRHRNAKRERLLDEYLTPMFNQVKAIHSDYRRALRSACKQLDEGRSPPLVARSLKRRKWDMQPERDALQKTGIALLNRKLPIDAASQFVFACVKYFSVLGSPSVYTRAINQLESPRPHRPWVRWAEGEIEYCWEKVVDRYAKVQAELA